MTLPADKFSNPPPFAPHVEGREAVSLTGLLEGVSRAIAVEFLSSQWFSAEISQFKEIKGGHYAVELVEHDDNGKLVARAQSFIWRGRADKVLAKFKLATSSDLTAGIKVLLSAKPEFSPAYGLRLVIDDIDPRYTLGDIEAKLKQIRLALAKEGVFSANKGLAEPVDFCRVAVVSPNAAADLGDFKADADQLEKSGLCAFDYFSSAFQGVDAAREIRGCLDSLGHSDADYDAVCIIRGGGSVTDLFWLNDLDLARAVCTCKTPIFTGIGHERDNTILDEVAHRRFDTPSKIIGHIRQTICLNALTAGGAFDEIIQHFHRQLSMADSRCHALILSIENAAATQLHQCESRVEQDAASLGPNVQRLLSSAENKLEQGIRWIESKAVDVLDKADRQLDGTRDIIAFHAGTALLDAERETEDFRRALQENAEWAIALAERNVESLGREILAVGPEATLRRGFALVRDSAGTPVVSSLSAKTQETLVLQFRDGEVFANPENDHY